MFWRTLFRSWMVLAAVLSASDLAFGMGAGLGQSKEELKLDYEVSVVDHGSGRVTVKMEIADEGRLKPLGSVYLVIASNDETGHVDLSAPLARREADGKQIIRVELIREWAERAEIQFRTSTLDGKQEPLTWYYYDIPIAEYLTSDESKQ